MFKKKSKELTEEDYKDLCTDEEEPEESGDAGATEGIKAKEPFKPAIGVEDYMKEILREVSDAPTDDDGEIKHIDIILKLSAGERIISEPIRISKFITVQFASLTGRQRQVISGFILDPVKLDDDGKPVINKALNRQITMAMMWYKLNDKELPDLLDRDIYDSVKKMSHELDARYNTIANWPIEWMSKFEKEIFAFNKKIIEAVSEANVKTF